MQIKNSCYKCDNRCIGCHSNCENYRKYRNALDVINNRRKEIKENNRLYIRRCKYGKSV